MKTLNNKERLVVFAIAAATFVSFLPSLTNGFVNWDDDTYLTQNPAIRSLSVENIGEIFSSFVAGAYTPLTILTFAVEYRLAGLHPTLYHVTNLLLHVLNTVLVFVLIRRLAGSITVAAITTVLFSIHPLRVESVAWITSRKDLLSGTFMLIAVITYVLHQERLNIRQQVILYVSYLLALLSKPVAIVLPLLLLLADFFLTRRLTKRDVLSKSALFAIAIIFGVLGIISQRTAGAANFAEMWRGPLLASYSVLFYAAKTILPYPLSVIYPYPQNTFAGLPVILIMSSIACLGILIPLFLFCKKIPNFALGVLFFVTGLLPVMQFVQVGQILADRYTYLASIGIAYLFAHGFNRLHGKVLVEKKVLQGITALFLLFVCVTFAAMTWDRCRVWHDSITLWNDAIAKHPSIHLSFNNRGQAYYELNSYDKALSDLRRAIAIKSDYTEAHYNLGLTYYRIADYANALKEYNSVFLLDSLFFEAYNGRGNVYLELGDQNGAMADFNRALSINPRSTNAFINRGNVYFRSHHHDRALGEYNTAIDLDPDLAQGYYNRALVYYMKDDLPRARSDMTTALRLGHRGDTTVIKLIFSPEVQP